jgi:hypothetical protein
LLQPIAWPKTRPSVAQITGSIFQDSSRPAWPDFTALKSQDQSTVGWWNHPMEWKCTDQHLHGVRSDHPPAKPCGFSQRTQPPWLVRRENPASHVSWHCRPLANLPESPRCEWNIRTCNMIVCWYHTCIWFYMCMRIYIYTYTYIYIYTYIISFGHKSKLLPISTLGWSVLRMTKVKKIVNAFRPIPNC